MYSSEAFLQKTWKSLFWVNLINRFKLYFQIWGLINEKIIFVHNSTCVRSYFFHKIPDATKFSYNFLN